MKAKIILVTVLGLFTTLFILNDLPQAIVNHGIEIAWADNGNHYGYGHSDGNNNGTQETAVSVPEPSTFLLLGAGLAGVGMLRRRFKK